MGARHADRRTATGASVVFERRHAYAGAADRPQRFTPTCLEVPVLGQRNGTSAAGRRERRGWCIRSSTSGGQHVFQPAIGQGLSMTLRADDPDMYRAIANRRRRSRRAIIKTRSRRRHPHRRTPACRGSGGLTAKPRKPVPTRCGQSNTTRGVCSQGTGPLAAVEATGRRQDRHRRRGSTPGG